jgi:hypothetical protein
VFQSKQGMQLTAPTVFQCWSVVRAAAGLDRSYDLCRCTKRRAVNRLFKLGVSKRAIAAQMGWSEKGRRLPAPYIRPRGRGGARGG